MLKMVEQAQRNQNNPVEFFKQITNNRSPEQMNAFYKHVEQMGFPTDIINQFKQ